MGLGEHNTGNKSILYKLPNMLIKYIKQKEFDMSEICSLTNMLALKILKF